MLCYRQRRLLGVVAGLGCELSAKAVTLFHGCVFTPAVFALNSYDRTNEKNKKKKNTNINKKTREVAKKKHTCRTVHSLCMTQNEAESPKKKKKHKKRESWLANSCWLCWLVWLLHLMPCADAAASAQVPVFVPSSLVVFSSSGPGDLNGYNALNVRLDNHSSPLRAPLSPAAGTDAMVAAGSWGNNSFGALSNVAYAAAAVGRRAADSTEHLDGALACDSCEVLITQWLFLGALASCGCIVQMLSSRASAAAPQNACQLVVAFLGLSCVARGVSRSQCLVSPAWWFLLPGLPSLGCGWAGRSRSCGGSSVCCLLVVLRARGSLVCFCSAGGGALSLISGRGIVLTLCWVWLGPCGLLEALVCVTRLLCSCWGLGTVFLGTCLGRSTILCCACCGFC